jgi:hypothetical protein
VLLDQRWVVEIVNHAFVEKLQYRDGRDELGA